MGRLTGLNLGPLTLKFDKDARRKDDRRSAQDIVARLTREALAGVNNDATKNVIGKGIKDLQTGSANVISGKQDLGTSTLLSAGLENAKIKGSTLLSDDTIKSAKKEASGFVDETSKLAVDQSIRKLTDYSAGITEKDRVVGENIDNLLNHPSLGSSARTVLTNPNFTDTQKVDYLFGLTRELAGIKTQGDRAQLRIKDSEADLVKASKNKTLNNVIKTFKPASYGMVIGDAGQITLGGDQTLPLSAVGNGAYTADIKASHGFFKDTDVSEKIKLDDTAHFFDNTVKLKLDEIPTQIGTSDTGEPIIKPVAGTIDFDSLNYGALYHKYLRTKFDDEYSRDDFESEISQYLRSQIFGGSKQDFDSKLADNIDLAISSKMADQLYSILETYDVNAKAAAYAKYVDEAGTGTMLGGALKEKTADINEAEFFREYEVNQSEMFASGKSYDSYMRAHREGSQDKFLRAASNQFNGLRQRFVDVLNRYGDETGSLKDALTEKIGYDVEEFFEHTLLNGDISVINNSLIQIGRYLELNDNDIASMIKYVIDDQATFANVIKLRDKIYKDDMNSLAPEAVGLKGVYGNVAAFNKNIAFSGDEQIFEDIRLELAGDNKTILENLYKEVKTNSKLGNLLSSVETEYSQSQGSGLTIGGGDPVDASDADVLADQIAELDAGTESVPATTTEVASVVNVMLPDLAQAGIDVDTYLDELLKNMNYMARDKAKFKQDIINQLNFDIG